ncbi:MAG TPA: hypothetical protein VEQ60_11660, partial [Longimicrobium sp.]|nr:hypothetical protein [Longimicrobium sp.]
WNGVTEIHGSGTDDVWAGGGGYGDIHHFDGRRWSKVPAINENWSNVWAQAPDNAYVVGGAFGNVIRWNGTGWEPQFSRVYGRAFWDVWGFDEDDVYLTGGWWNTAAQRYDGFVWHWNGTAWDSTAMAPGRAVGTIWGTSPTNLYGLSGGNTVLRYDGTSWTQVAGGASTPGLREIWGTGPDDIWVVGGGYHGGGPESTVLHWDGVAWAEVQTGGLRTVNGVFSPNPDKVYLVGYQGMIHRRSGGQWAAESSGQPRLIAGVAAVSESDVITAECGGLKRNTGPGGAWQTIYATDDCLEKVWVTPGASQIFAVGNGVGEWGRGMGVIVRWDGSQWTRTLFPNVTYLHGVWGLDSTHVYAVGWGDEMGMQVPRLYQWDGAAWTEISTGQASGQLWGVWGTSPDDLWVVGHMVLHWDGQTWSRQYVHEWSDGWTDVWGTGPDNVFLAGGRVAHWNGTQWTSFYPHLNYQGSGVWGSGPGDVYVVGTRTLHYNGSAWTEMNIETGSGLSDIGGVSARHVWAVGAGGAVMRGRR